MVPGFGPAHAAHLTMPNLEDMIGETSLLEKKLKPNYKIISGSNNRPMKGPTLRQLLQQSLEDVLQHGTNPDRVFEAGISSLNSHQETSLFILGNTSYLPSFKRMLQKKRLEVAVKPTGSSREILERHVGSESVAIVGMSGRFPGSDTIEELWTSIMERREFHQTVRQSRLKLIFLVDEYLLYRIDSP